MLNAVMIPMALAAVGCCLAVAVSVLVNVLRDIIATFISPCCADCQVFSR